MRMVLFTAMVVGLVFVLSGCKHDEANKPPAPSNATVTKEETSTKVATVTNKDGSKTITTDTCSCKNGLQSCTRKVEVVPAPAKPPVIAPIPDAPPN